MRHISDMLRSQRWLGAGQQAITDIVNIGIGGSDLGKQLANCIIEQLDARDVVSSHDASTNALINNYKKYSSKK